jgi:hypothetical protein
MALGECDDRILSATLLTSMILRASRYLRHRRLLVIFVCAIHRMRNLSNHPAHLFGGDSLNTYRQDRRGKWNTFTALPITAVCIKIGICEPRSVVSRHVTLVETLARGSSLVMGHLGMQCWFCSACSSLYHATQSAHSKAIYTLYALVRTRTTRSRRPPEPPCTPAVPVPMIRGVAKMGRHLYVSAKRCIYYSSVC